MKCLFLTRCYKTTNLKRIQENLESVFRHTDHTYRHIILADLTHGTDIDEFQQYSLVSGVYPIVKKPSKDEYCTQAIDDCLYLIGDDVSNTCVYVLDDDNLILPEFLAALDRAERTGAEVVVFKVEGHPDWGNKEDMKYSAVGKIDWSNYITSLFYMKHIGVYNPNANSHDADGVFFDALNNEFNIGNIEYMDKICGCYNALPKP